MFIKRLEHLLIKSPKLYCENCFDIFKSTKKQPLCRTEKGCPIIDVAPLVTINRRVEKFRQYKVLAETKTPESILLQLLEQSGIKDDMNTLIQAESIYSQWRQREYSKRNKK